MRFFKYFVLPAICSFLIAGCSALDYHPYDTLIKGETSLTEKNIKRIESTLAGRSSFRFAVISDTQRWYDETALAVNALNRMNNVDFVIHCGDQADFGITDEFIKMRDMLSKLKMPWICLMGNHDYLGTGEFCYNKIYGKSNFGFTIGDTRFVCLNTNSLEDNSQPDFNYINREQKELSGDIKKTFVAMHIKPFCVEFNNNIANDFQQSLKEFPNLQCCINGHNHVLEQCDLFNDGTIYYGAPSIDCKKILLFTVNEEDYLYEEVDF